MDWIRIAYDDDVVGVDRRIVIGAAANCGDVVEARHLAAVDGAQDHDILLPCEFGQSLG
jgi:hypothetical protein